MQKFFHLGASRKHRPPNVNLGPPNIWKLLELARKLNLKIQLDMVKYPFWVAYTNYYIIRYNMRVAAIRVVNTRVLGYPGPVWPTQVPTWVP